MRREHSTRRRNTPCSPADTPAYGLALARAMSRGAISNEPALMRARVRPGLLRFTRYLSITLAIDSLQEAASRVLVVPERVFRARRRHDDSPEPGSARSSPAWPARARLTTLVLVRRAAVDAADAARRGRGTGDAPRLVRRMRAAAAGCGVRAGAARGRGQPSGPCRRDAGAQARGAAAGQARRRRSGCVGAGGGSEGIRPDP